MCELDALVSKFVHVYEDSKVSITLFLKGYWRSKMTSWLLAPKTPSVEQIQLLRQIGVTIESVDERKKVNDLLLALPVLEDMEGELEKSERSDPNCTHQRNGSHTKPTQTTDISSDHEIQIGDGMWIRILDTFGMN